MKDEYRKAVPMCPSSAPYTWLGLAWSSWVQNWVSYVIIDFHSLKLQASLTAALKTRVLCFKTKLLFCSGNEIYFCMCFSLQGKISDQVYNYPEGLGEVLYREQFDFNAEPPWEPSWW